MTAVLSRPFRSLAVPNYRRYFTGQVISVSGNWMQTVAELWLVLRLTGSGVALGLTTALQFAPILFGGVWGGLLADRVSKRRLLMVTQTLMALPALALFVLTVSGSVRLWMIFALVFARGTVNAVDNPTRQSFLIEMVGPDRVLNAVGLNSALVQTARVVGPALAGVLIATVGVGACFGLNALSFGAMLVALWLMRPRELLSPAPSRRQPGQLRSGLRYVRATPALLIPLVLMAVVGTLAYNFQVLLPLMARYTFHGSAASYAAMTSAMGGGALLGALATSARVRVRPGAMALAAIALGTLMLGAAGAPSFALELAVLVPMGAASVVFAASVNSTLQLSVAPEMRGRVMALYSVVFLGSTPIGGPLLGWLAGAAGPRSGLLVGAAAAIGAGLVARVAFRRNDRERGEPRRARMPRWRELSVPLIRSG